MNIRKACSNFILKFSVVGEILPKIFRGYNFFCRVLYTSSLLLRYCYGEMGCSLVGRRLFRRAIVHGGSAMASWAVAANHRAYTAALAERLNCTGGDDAGGPSTAATRLAVHCLRQVSAAGH